MDTRPDAAQPPEFGGREVMETPAGPLTSPAPHAAGSGAPHEQEHRIGGRQQAQAATLPAGSA
jgi:hypothetical protein